MAGNNHQRKPPVECPVCGEQVPPRALACPECGADYQSGWKEGADSGNLGLPDEEFDYNEFVEREFGEKSGVKKPAIGWLWWGVAVALIIGIALGILRIL